MSDKRSKIIEMLTQAYWMELETVINYLANSIHLDGVRAEEIKQSLAADVQEELGHAQSFARRIKELGGSIPGSVAFRPGQDMLQPPADSTDVVSVIRGVIAAEEAAIKHYNALIRECEGFDYVTQDLAIQILANEETHRRDFIGFLREYEKKQ